MIGVVKQIVALNAWIVSSSDSAVCFSISTDEAP